MAQVLSYMKVNVNRSVEIIATMAHARDIAVGKYRYGKGVNYYIALQSDSFLDRFSSLYRLVREFIRENSGTGMVEMNLENTLVLRMDDPGTCERVYLNGFDTRLMGKEEWEGMTAILKEQQATVSVMYIPFWVDDANGKNGRLFVKSHEIKERRKGAVYESKDVTFMRERKDGTVTVYDYPREFLALKDALSSGVVDVESHGLTHVDPDLDKWARTEDRYWNRKWYHEFRHVYDNRDVAEEELVRITRESAQKLVQLFGISPTTITPSGHEQSMKAEPIAYAHGYKLFSSDYNAFSKHGIIIRNSKLRSVFFELTQPDSSFSEAGCPVVGVFHDFDIVKRGLVWLAEVLRDWKEKGALRIITLRELAGYLCSSVEAYCIDNTIYITIDISNTGGVSGEYQMRYFSRQGMDIFVTLPDGRKIKSLFVDGIPHNEINSNMAGRHVTITVPPFHEKDRQEITISL
jgi:hypothetical protein